MCDMEYGLCIAIVAVIRVERCVRVVHYDLERVSTVHPSSVLVAVSSACQVMPETRLQG